MPPLDLRRTNRSSSAAASAAAASANNSNVIGGGGGLGGGGGGNGNSRSIGTGDGGGVVVGGGAGKQHHYLHRTHERSYGNISQTTRTRTTTTTNTTTAATSARNNNNIGIGGIGGTPSKIRSSSTSTQLLSSTTTSSSLGGGGGGGNVTPKILALTFTCTSLITCFFLYITGLATYQRNHIHSLTLAITQNEDMMDEMEEYRNKLAMADRKTQNLQREYNRLNRHLNEVKIESKNDEMKKQREIESIKLVKDTIDEEAKTLEKEIQKICKTEVIEKFGPGPHRVEMEINIPNTKNTKEEEEEGNTKKDHHSSTKSKIIIEMASIELMPHSIYLFLEQVSHGLWDGCSFFGSSDSVLLSSTLSSNWNILGIRTDRLWAFQEVNHDGLAFQEYNDLYPNLQYTIAFSGRPGGPTFHFNIQDNSNKEMDGKDACFGTIVEGQDVVHTIANLPKRAVAFHDIVGILSARIIPSLVGDNNNHNNNDSAAADAAADGGARGVSDNTDGNGNANDSSGVSPPKSVAEEKTQLVEEKEKEEEIQEKEQQQQAQNDKDMTKKEEEEKKQNK